MRTYDVLNLGAGIQSSRVREKAKDLLLLLLVRACQHSGLLITETETIWFTCRDDNPAAK